MTTKENPVLTPEQHAEILAALQNLEKKAAEQLTELHEKELDLPIRRQLLSGLEGVERTRMIRVLESTGIR